MKFMRKNYMLSLLLAGLGGILFVPGFGQTGGTPELFHSAQFRGLQWRNVGPFRGGRCVAVTGVRQKPFTFYMGAAGGGLWLTEDGGIHWRNISDGFFSSGSIGAIAVSESDPNVVYAGTGEHSARGNTTAPGDGVYKSTDGGRTWTHTGLIHSRHISAIRIHPANPEVVFVAVQGALFGPNPQRGVYRTTNGGRTWEQILHVNPTTGASDLAIDMSNPRILYAAMWDHQRTPWHIRSGGLGCGLYKSSDGGDNWEKLSQGLPASIGKIGIAVSRSAPDRLYAVVEAENGGVYRSEDAGRTWAQTNSNRVTFARSWYYAKIEADPQDPETVYVLNAPLLRSIDGGRTFQQIENPHTDQHALWIHPDRPQTMILGNDGGACISFNHGKSWSAQDNQPTGQLYRIATDKQFPYRIYSGQQDYGAFSIASRSAADGLTNADWKVVGPGESAFIAFDPANPQSIFSTGYQGHVHAFTPSDNTLKDLMAYPALGLGNAPADQKFRFNWNAPLIMDPHKPGILYHGAQAVLRSTDGGMSWRPISPDLTRNDLSKQGNGGGPFINEGAGGEVYNTISYLAASPHQAGELWVGSDDGRLHLTRNDGKTWQEVTPPDLGEALIHCIEVSPHQPGQALIAATRHKLNDPAPFVFITTDYGVHWTSITEGFGIDNPVRAVREDPIRPGLFYAGTERGLFISLDRGHFWHRFQLNLPLCPINDLAIRDNDLIAATEGRALWILDDLSPLQQYPALARNAPGLTQPKPAYRFETAQQLFGQGDQGQNPPGGMLITYYLPEKAPQLPVKLEILNAKGQVIRRFHSQADRQPAVYEGGPPAEPLLPSMPGYNRFAWDLRRETLPGIPKVYINGDYRGGLVAPGTYRLRLLVHKDTLETKAAVLADPRLSFLPGAYLAQEEFLTALEAQIRDVFHSIAQMRDIREQIQNLIGYLEKAEDCAELVASGKQVVERVDVWETGLIQPLQQTSQDVINYPGRLSAELLDLKNRADGADPRLTEGLHQRFTDLKTEWAAQRKSMQDILNRELASFKKIFRQKDIPGLIIPAVTAF
ncbi:MAG: hypothetical protein KIPDCIKN_02892 [Haliscomenobacter sp.]|nr:hypothetical protein [Haliscomenobacter sp.]